MNRNRRLTTVLTALAAAFPAAFPIFGQMSRPVWDGVYTQQQANRGKVIYAEQCANCHGAELNGSDETPGLTGDRFMAKWSNRTVDDFFEKIRVSMPVDRPGSLSRPKTADLVAYIFGANKIPAGAAELGSQSEILRQIRFQRPGASPGVTAARSVIPEAELAPVMVEGQPIDRRPPEKSDNRPAFPEQTRAPYHASAPFQSDDADRQNARALERRVSARRKDSPHRTAARAASAFWTPTASALRSPWPAWQRLTSPGAKDIGVLDVVLDPHFATNHQIFFTFFDYVDGTNSNTYVVRARLDEDKCALIDAKVIFRAQPAMPSKRLGGKTGGRIAIAPDGNPVRDHRRPSDSPPWDVAQRMDNRSRQDHSHHARRRACARQSVPRQSRAFCRRSGPTGLRSQEGLAFDPETGAYGRTEHGPRGGDELNIIEKGKNYGWPVVAHGIDYPGTAIGEGITHKEGMEEPVYYWDPVIAPSGLAFYTGNLFPQWQNSVFVGGLRGMMLDRLTIVNDKVVSEEPLLTDLNTRIRDVRVGPDGAVYVLTDSGTPSMSAEYAAHQQAVEADAEIASSRGGVCATCAACAQTGPRHILKSLVRRLATYVLIGAVHARPPHALAPVAAHRRRDLLARDRHGARHDRPERRQYDAAAAAGGSRPRASGRHLFPWRR